MYDMIKAQNNLNYTNYLLAFVPLLFTTLVKNNPNVISVHILAYFKDKRIRSQFKTFFTKN